MMGGWLDEWLACWPGWMAGCPPTVDNERATTKDDSNQICVETESRLI